MSGWLDILKEEAKGYNILINILVLGLTYIICLVPIYLILIIMDVSIPEPQNFGVPIMSWFFLSAMILVVLTEEILFRLIPIFVSTKIWRVDKKVIYVVLASSLVFGYLHGNLINILIHGVGGVWLSFIFLKCGGFQNRYLKGLTASFLTHLTVNLTAALSYIINGINTF